MESLFHNDQPDRAPTPYELIEPEIVHLKKGYSIRHGEKRKDKQPPWLIALGICGLLYLYLMDPICFAWYKGDAIRDYLYLHNYGTGTTAERLAASRILTPDEVEVLNHRQGSFQDYYVSPAAADAQATKIIGYMAAVQLLHQGRYQQLDPVGRMRYLLFIRTGLILPTKWSAISPSVE